MKLSLPELCLVVLVGTSGSGKSTFARKHFKSTEVLSSDYCRGLVSDDENDQAATKDAFEVLHYIAGKRLRAGKLTVVDATNVQPESRKSLIKLARDHHCLPVAIVLDVPEKTCAERNEQRADRQFGPHVIRMQHQQLRRSVRGLAKEGFRYVCVLDSPEKIETVEIERQPLWTNKKSEHGPFDIIGDVHGCYDELAELLTSLGYLIERTADDTGSYGFKVTADHGRKAIFLGDLVDRGPKVPDVLRLVMSMVKANTALCVPGNHENKLMRKLRGRDVRITHGLAETLAQLEAESDEFKNAVAAFIDDLVSHFVLDDGKLVVAHAGLKEEFQGRGSSAVREFALYGETTGETDSYGLPVRYNWAADYRGRAMVVYGHTPVPDAEWLNNTICLDTGCVFGGRLTALKYPEKELVSVPAAYTYYEPAKPFLSEEAQAEPAAMQRDAEMLDVSDVIGKRIIGTRLRHNITVREENAIAALEVMSRFAVNPKWLIYLPPTMSPCETATEDGYLEHPKEAFEYFRKNGISHVICEEKHMGSRAILIVCKDEESASRRFRVHDEGSGVCFTRTGRRFFPELALEQEVVGLVRQSLDAADFWQRFDTDWVILDCELMPWSAKAQELLRSQYASVGFAANSSLLHVNDELQKAVSRGLDCRNLVDDFSRRLEQSQKFVRAYSQYCWPVNSIEDYKLAPFHILATEGKVHFDRPHPWHMEEVQLIVATGGSLLTSTKCMTIDVTESEQIAEGIRWWESLTASGGEGMVVKPIDFIATGPKGLVQPAVKCRGPEYLRIIYGPEYDSPANLERLRSRGLATKRSLALREFALGIEGLERFVRREPLYRYHECVFAVLALESEPVDPRL